MGSCTLIGTLAAAAATVACFALYKNNIFHQGDKENGFLFFVSFITFIFFISFLVNYFAKRKKSSLSPTSSPPSSLSPPSSPPSSSSHIITCSPSSHNCAHQVFPSFHGTDVRKSFLSHILKEFKSKGINPFIDNDIKRSKSIGPALKEAIRGSKIAIVLLSRNYASSSWCLDELVEIMKCREVLGQTVMTVFYEVDPTDVKKQTGDFGKVFKKTCAGKTKEETETWRQALAKVATIAGEHSKKWDNEAAMIEKITTDISNKLNYSASSNDFDGLIGMRAHMEQMEQLLCLGSDEVRMIGIWGPPGIGKTTIARSLYNRFSSSFQHSVFMENIDASMYTIPRSDDYSPKRSLQQQFMSQIFQKDIKIPHLGVARERLKDKKVLVILDNVERSIQLEAMAKDTSWFGPGSRVIITTQDMKIIKPQAKKHIYKVDFPPPHEALQIFCNYAFGQSSPYDGFEKLAREITNLAGELPLGLRVIGSYFRGMSKERWKKEMPRLRLRLNGEIASILQLSYDALDKEDQDLFLYIACLFNNESIEKVEAFLPEDMRQGLDVLYEKSLISMNSSGVIEMHKLLEQLGREIVRDESIREPGNRRFLVNEKDICEVLGDCTGSRTIIGIRLDLSELSRDLNISERAFENLSNLEVVKIQSPVGNQRNQLHVPHGLNDLSGRLRVLHWDHFPMTCFPSSFNPEFLVELNMYGSKLEKMWEGTKSIGKLKWMNLSYSENLKELPDLSTATNLEELYLSKCTSLVELPFSIGNATHLRSLDLVHCSSLIKLPSSVGNITSLQRLDLANCSSLVELPSSIANLINLEKMDLSHCSSLVELPCLMNANSLRELDLRHCSSLVELASFIGNAINLQKLDLSYCSSLPELPSSMGNNINLTELCLKGCSKLVELPNSIGKATILQKLYLNDCSSLVKLPSSIGNVRKLEKLDLSNCSSLEELPSSIGNVFNLSYLNLIGCSRLVKLPSSVGSLTNLKILYLNNCSKLVALHSSIGNAINLEKLDLSNCSSLVELPSSIGNATNLRKLKLVNCTSLVELPSSIGNLCKLQMLSLRGCSKLEVLSLNINMESMTDLDLKDCSLLKSFPENIEGSTLNGKAIEEAPSFMSSWYRLSKLKMSYCESLKELPQALNCITELHLSNTEIEEVSSWVKRIPRLRRFVLNGCRKLESLPQLSDSLSSLHAANCGSLEKLDCAFHNPQIRLDFSNCIKLNKDARALIIHTSTRRHVILPGRKVPACFAYRATGGSLIVKLKERPLPISLRFKACILPIRKGDDDTVDDESLMPVYIRILDKHKGFTVACKSRDHFLPPPLTGHLYVFEIEAKVTATDLIFEFNVNRDNWEIGECGVMVFMEVPRVHEHEVSSDSDIGEKH